MRRLGPGLVIVVLVASLASTHVADAGGYVRGPVASIDFPDPMLVRDGTTYYLFATNSSLGNVPVARSSDLNTWSVVGDALPKVGPWANAGFTWAPGVAHIDSTWVLFYTANDAASGRQCIGHAVASQPTGPYVDLSSAPIVCQLDHGGSIDASVYDAGAGVRWLVWKSDDNAIDGASHLWSQQLSRDGSSLVGAPHDLLTLDQGWESPTIEGPSFASIGGRLLLFYAGGWWESTSAAIGFASCTAPAGPCQKDTTTAPWMSTGNSGAAGPQGPSLATSTNGTSVLAFSAWTGAVGYANGGRRAPFVEPLDTTPTWRPDRPRAGPTTPALEWLLRGSPSPGLAEIGLFYGGPDAVPVTGDWNGDGSTDIGVYVNGWWYLRDSAAPGPPDRIIHYGSAGDTPVTGDWNGLGHSDIGVYRDGWWYLRDFLNAGPPTRQINYGAPGYVPVTGDFNGDGLSDIGVYVDGWWLLRNNALVGGSPDHTIHYGASGYTPVVGDWNGDATSDVGVYVGGWWLLRNSLTAGPPDRVVTYGSGGTTPVVGHWNSGGDGIGVAFASP